MQTARRVIRQALYPIPLVHAQFRRFQMKMKTIAILVNAALFAMANPVMADQGPSTLTAPYVQPMVAGVNFTSILTTGDVVGGYKMGGVPDGLGAYDNSDGTITVLMNHEIPTAALGVVRAHGAKGAYVSSWVIDKTTLKVLSGADLMKNVFQQVGGAWVPVTGPALAFARFCSADLANQSAFFHEGKGTHNRIFLNGEESGAPNMRGVAHVATGPDKGSSYLLPWASAASNAAWENLLANPYSGDRTVVIGNADGGTNGLYVYVGTKTRTGNDVERAGLVNGTLFRVAVTGNAPETRAADAGLGLVANARGNLEAGFTLVAGPDTTNAASTKFLRPEDGAWDKRNKNRYYFVTTDQPDAAKDSNANSDIPAGQVGRSRLWALNFVNSAQPELGGKIELLLNGTVANGEYQMLDNIAVNDDGTLIMLEDIGNNKHNGKMWKFDPATGDLVKIAHFDQALFGDIGGPAGTLTKDEETSGVIDVTKLLDRNDGRVYNLFVVQNHAPSGDAETVEGGQLVLMSMPAAKKRRDDDNDDDHRD
jgi:hypothetical protein